MLDKFREIAITWDKANRKVYEPLRVSAGDNKGRKLSVQVVNGGVIESLSGASLSLFWETKDKAHKGLDAFTAVDATKGEFEIYYTTGMLSNEGTLNANLVLVDASGRIVSEPFTITVFKGIDDEAIQSSDSFTALTEALAQVGTINNKADRAELLALESTFEQNKVSVEQQLQQTGANLQSQIDTLVVQSGGDSNPEVLQARVNSSGVVHPTLKSHLDSLGRLVSGNKKAQTHEWEQGSIQVSSVDNTASDVESTTRLRTVGLSRVDIGDKLYVEVESGYQYTLRYYNDSGTFVSHMPTFLTGKTEISMAHPQYRVVLAKTNNTTIVASDGVKFKAHVDNQNEEVIDARRDSSGNVYESLGERLRSAKVNIENVDATYNFVSKLNFELGTISSASGANAVSGSGATVRSVGFVKAKAGDTVKALNSNYVFAPFLYNSENVSDFRSAGGVFVSEYTFAEDCYVRFTATMVPANTEILNHLSEMDNFILMRTANIKEETQKSINAVTSRWYGKKWNALGDSLTDRPSGPTVVGQIKYHEYLKFDKGFSNVRNYGERGTTIAQGTRANSFVERYSAMDNDADLITVFGGVNDFMHNQAPLGVLGDTVPTTLYGALETLLVGLKNKYPTAQLAFFTPLMKPDGETPNSQGVTLPQIRQAIIEVCEKHATPYLDLYKVSGFDTKLQSVITTYMSDGVHPNDAGHRVLAYKIGAFLETL